MQGSSRWLALLPLALALRQLVRNTVAGRSTRPGQPLLSRFALSDFTVEVARRAVHKSLEHFRVKCGPAKYNMPMHKARRHNKFHRHQTPIACTTFLKQFA